MDRRAYVVHGKASASQELTQSNAACFGFHYNVRRVVYVDSVYSGQSPNGIFNLCFDYWLCRYLRHVFIAYHAAEYCFRWRCGCCATLLGWTAMTGEIHSNALKLFLIIFIWTPPHFWALVIKRREEYSKPMCLCCP